MTNADLLALEIDWDIATGKVSVNGRTIGVDMLQPNLQSLLEAEGTEFAFAEMSKGDARPVDVLLLNNGQVIEPDITSLRYAIKEFDTGLLYPLNAEDGDDVVAVKKGGFTRFRLPLTFDSSQMLQVLQKYADPRGTFVDVITEMQLTANYKLSQTAGVDTAPSTQTPAAAVTYTQSVYLPLGLEEGESKEFTTTVTVENIVGASLATQIQFGEFRNVQKASRTVTFTAEKDGGTVGITAGGEPSSPLEEFNQHPYQIAPYPVWIASVEFKDFTIDGENAKIDVEVITEAFDHPAFNLPATGWAADLVIPCVSWEKYAHTGRIDAGPNDVYITNYGDPYWANRLELILVDGNGDEVNAFTINGRTNGDRPTMSELISTASGNFYIMGGVIPAAQTIGALQYHTFRLFFPADPDAVTARLRFDSGDFPDQDFPIAPVTPGTTAPIRLSATQVAEEDPEEAVKVARLSTSSFVTRLRKDLNPDPAPAVDESA